MGITPLKMKTDANPLQLRPSEKSRERIIMYTDSSIVTAENLRGMMVFENEHIIFIQTDNSGSNEITVSESAYYRVREQHGWRIDHREHGVIFFKDLQTPQNRPAEYKSFVDGYAKGMISEGQDRGRTNRAVKLMDKVELLTDWIMYRNRPGKRADRWLVSRVSGYLVTRCGKFYSCQCDDFQKNCVGSGMQCKHILATLLLETFIADETVWFAKKLADQLFGMSTDEMSDEQLKDHSDFALEVMSVTAN